MATKTSAEGKPARVDEDPVHPKARWNTQNLKNSYANIHNTTSTCENVVLNFGVTTGSARSRTWGSRSRTASCCRRLPRTTSRGS
jgi:hypothetical protein